MILSVPTELIRKRIEALQWLETLTDDQVEAIKDALCREPSKQKVVCEVCGESFQRSGIKRHQSVMHDMRAS